MPRSVRFRQHAAFGALALCLTVQAAAAADSIKIAFIDPLSGPLAVTGERVLDHLKIAADMVNKSGGVLGRPLEIVTYDDEGNAEKALVSLKSAIDDGVQYVAQGLSAPVGYALLDAINKQNKRNPDQRLVFLNTNGDPGFSNDRCSFWSFRFDADATMRSQALTSYIASRPDVSKVYLINQDYSTGQAIEHDVLTMLHAKMKNAEIVGTDRVPLGKVKDFSPYMAKIMASGADAVVTSNWGSDLVLLAKSAAESGYKGKIFTFFFGGAPGTTTSLGAAAKGIVQVNEFNSNIDAPLAEELVDQYKREYKGDYGAWKISLQVFMLAQAMTDAKSVEPLKVAHALEDMKYAMPWGASIMRKEDHQILEPLFISALTDGVKHDLDGSGLGFKTLEMMKADASEVQTTCKMQAP